MGPAPTLAPSRPSFPARKLVKAHMNTVYLLIERNDNDNSGTVMMASLNEKTIQDACDYENSLDPIEPARFTVIARDLAD